jgi:choline dehydrogenase-like flavoprotein
MTPTKPQETDFSKDVLGRYICNGFDEAMNSTDKSLSRKDGSPQSDALPFDIIIVGGGSFGPVLAQHLFEKDKSHSHRILILEAGPLVLTEHFQNYPILGLFPPGATETDPQVPRNELWGLPWLSDVKAGFPGLAYCIGGRSVFFGGWSPQLLDFNGLTEMPDDKWPAVVKSDLNNKYFAEAASQIGTDASNDFIQGDLHEALRKQLHDGIKNNQVAHALPLSQLPASPGTPLGTPAAKVNELKLEAPLAVQTKTSSGLFPINKFSAVPLLIDATRKASSESMYNGSPDDVKKRIMIVPHCRVKKLNTEITNGTGRVTSIDTTQGPVALTEDAKVVIAVGTIESTRLAQLSFEGITNYDLIGKNLMAHLRSNLTIRIPRSSVKNLNPTFKALQASALFVKGSFDRPNGKKAFFHLQITASGVAEPTTDSEAELFKKVPDYDSVDLLNQSDDKTVVITIRGIGETEGRNPGSFIRLAKDKPADEVGLSRAFITYNLNNNDMLLWDAMDKASDDVAKVFADGKNFEVLSNTEKWLPANAASDLKAMLPYDYRYNGGRRDGMGTTHHEAGTLWMGTDPVDSVTDTNGKFHFVTNAYAAGPILFPTVGSPNPMLTGVALSRRLGDHLIPQPFIADAGYTMMFNGFDRSKWKMSTITSQPGRDNPGKFNVVRGAFEEQPGNDLGMLYYTDPMPQNYSLKLEFLTWRDDDNSGVFVRFPDINSKNYNNTAYVAINFGFEVQINNIGQGNPPGLGIHKTGAIYNFAAPNNPQLKNLGEWNQMEIQCTGQQYKVFLNGILATDYTNPDPLRGTETPHFVGLQTHTGRVSYRKIQFKAL